MKQKIGIIGKGNVGKALQAGAQRAGHETQMIGKGGGVKDTAAWADIVILAVPFTAVWDRWRRRSARRQTASRWWMPRNVLSKEGGLAVGFTTSGAEKLQKKMPGAHVVKAFNTIFAQNMSSGQGEEHRAVHARGRGRSQRRRRRSSSFARDIGFDAVDAGPLANARLLEPFGFLNIQLGYVINKGMGAGIGFALVR